MNIDKLKKNRKKIKKQMLLINVIVYVFFCFILNKLVNFPEHLDSIVFQIELMKAPLIVYFVGVAIVSYLIQSFIFKLLTKKINKFINKTETEEDKNFLKEVRDEAMSLSYKFILYNVLTIAAIDFLAFLGLYGFGKFYIANFEKIKIFYLRIGMLISAMWLLTIVFQYNFMQKYVNEILKASYKNNRFYYKNKFTITNTFNITMQIIPILITVIILFINYSYTNTINTYSKNIASYYDIYLSHVVVDPGTVLDRRALEDLEEIIPLWDDENIIFIIDTEGKVISKQSKEISSFMLNYMDKYFYYYTDENGKKGINLTQDHNIIYDSYGIDEHAYIRAFTDETGRKFYIGIKYFSGDQASFNDLMSSGIIILIAYASIIIYWAKANTENIKTLETYMKAILSDKDIMKQNFMPIMSNDELGNVAFYYNRIQEKIVTQRDIMFKQEQLSVLGELAGGMAHDINTPISSINTSILMLERNAKTEQEKELLDNMKIATDRIINIVNSMRNQIRNLGSNDKEKFSLNQMIKDLHVITQNEQKKSGCTFESEIDEEIVILGERTKLGQVLTNIVVNGIQAYVGNSKKGKVFLKAYKKNESICRIEITDEAGGIPEKVQRYLFKNIMTTKGSKGTGLGLYLASSVIKGIFQGDIWFEVENGVGTKFIIEIPMNMEE